MDARHIPGSVFVLVQDGRVLFQKGYGFADLNREIPMDAESTAFRVASLSKLFTATAVLQLVEQGRLDVNADVNRYLDEFQLEPVFDRPVTLTDLLTHASGLDVTVLAWKNRYWGWAGRVYYTLVALAALLYNYHLMSENLLRLPF